MSAPKLVIGANGFLGSHVTRQLVAAGAEVRAMVRGGANTRSIDDLEVTRFHGDVFDTATVRQAMDGCDQVYYCVVDTRAWLQDPSPLFRTNVEGLRNVLDVAKAAGLQRFVFTSTYATVDRRRGQVATEEDRIGDRRVSPYVQSRVQAEDLVMRYVADHSLPAVAMCVSTTYGGGDWGRTPHGAFIAGAVYGKLPFLMNGIALEVVGVDDAARAMISAAERGRDGEKYLISERMIPLKEVVKIAADEAGVPAPRRCDGQPASQTDRQRCRTQPRVGADDARRSTGRPRQGHPRIGLGAKAGRRVDSRGRAVLGRSEIRQAKQQDRSVRLRTQPAALTGDLVPGSRLSACLV
jgi:dihydroflavonol-4-reductase